MGDGGQSVGLACSPARAGPVEVSTLAATYNLRWMSASGPVSDQVIAYRRRNSHLSLLGHFQRVIHFYTEIADRAFELCIT